MSGVGVECCGLCENDCDCVAGPDGRCGDWLDGFIAAVANDLPAADPDEVETAIRDAWNEWGRPAPSLPGEQPGGQR